MKSVVCRKKWEFFGCYMEESVFGGIISFLLITIRWFMGLLGDYDCESTLFCLFLG